MPAVIAAVQFAVHIGVGVKCSIGLELALAQMISLYDTSCLKHQQLVEMVVEMVSCQAQSICVLFVVHWGTGVTGSIGWEWQ